MNSRRRLPGLLLVAALMIPGPARPDAPEEPVDTQPEETVETVDTQPNGDLDTQAETVDTQPKDGEDVDTQQTGTSDEERSARASGDVFVPTEKVSEDLSVAFPVDI